jgi:phosphoglycolate phosphatase
MRKAVIFDLDGTLLDTVADLGDAANDMLKARGLPIHDYEAYKIFIGNGMKLLVTRALPPDKRQEEFIQSALAEMEENYSQNWKNKTRAYEGVSEMLDEIERRGLPMAILSNKPDRFTKQTVRAFFSRRRFAVVRGARDGVPIKPDPRAALEIAAEMDFPPKDICYLGDTRTDMETARRAGMYPIGALWGFRSAEELKEHGAEHLIKHPMELLPFLQD